MLVRLLVLVLVIMDITKLVFANMLAMLTLLAIMVLACASNQSQSESALMCCASSPGVIGTIILCTSSALSNDSPQLQVLFDCTHLRDKLTLQALQVHRAVQAKSWLHEVGCALLKQCRKTWSSTLQLTMSWVPWQTQKLGQILCSLMGPDCIGDCAVCLVRTQAANMQTAPKGANKCQVDYKITCKYKSCDCYLPA